MTNIIKNVFKRAISILLVPIVLICTSGGVFYMEKCGMSKNPTYSLSEGKQCCCSKAMHDKCCKQSKIVIKKIEDNYFSSASANIPLIKSLQFTLPVLPSLPMLDISVSSQVLAFDHAPPNSASLSVLYRSLLL